MARKKRTINSREETIKGSGLKPAFPVQGGAPSTHCVYVFYPSSAPAGQARQIAIPFAALYAARHFVDQAIAGEEFKWQPVPRHLRTKKEDIPPDSQLKVIGDPERIKAAIDHYNTPDTIVTADDVEIKCPGHGLEEILEYEMTAAEREWELPARFVMELARLKRPWPDEFVERPSRDPDDEDAPKAERPKREKKERTPKPDRTGLVSVADIAAQLGVDPKEARGALRKAKWEKPAAGWAFPPAEVEDVRKAIKANLK